MAPLALLILEGLKMPNALGTSCFLFSYKADVCDKVDCIIAVYTKNYFV